MPFMALLRRKVKIFDRFEKARLAASELSLAIALLHRLDKAYNSASP